MNFNIKHINTILKVMGLNLLLENNSVKTYAFCILEIKKGEIQIIEQGITENVDEIPFEKELPIVINITGDNIISKRIMYSNLNELEALNSVLPSVKAEDFLIQNYYNEHTFCSLVRLETVESILSIFTRRDVFILSLSLNHFAITNCYFLLNNTQEVALGNFLFKYENNNLLEIEPINSTQSFIIDNKNLNSFELSAFAVAFQFLAAKESSINISEFLEEANTEYQQKLIFDKVKLVIPLIFLILLLINFLVFSTAQEKNDLLVQKVQNNQQILTQLDSLKAEVNAKEKFLKEEQWFSHSKVSFYADRIASSLPSEISLQSLKIYPLKETESNEELDYENELLEITGVTESALILNTWTKELKLEDWINETEITDYQQKKSNEAIHFLIIINLKKI